MSSGSCQCGAVQYQLGGDPLFTYVCYCKDCQKRSGAAASMGMFVALDNLQVSGALSSWERHADSGVHKTRYSCSACGNVIYGVASDRPGLALLQPGTLDNSETVYADVHLWTKRAQPWVSIPADAPQYAEQPADAGEMMAAIARYRASR